MNTPKIDPLLFLVILHLTDNKIFLFHVINPHDYSVFENDSDPLQFCCVIDFI